MNLDQIKGIIEIDGKKFDGAQIFAALIDQGFSVSYKNGVLRIGRALIEPNNNFEEEYKICPIVDNCKTYEKIMRTINEKAKTFLSGIDLQKKNTPNPSTIPTYQHVKTKSIERFYEDDIELNKDELIYQNIGLRFSLDDIQREVDTILDGSYGNNDVKFQDPDPIRMVGVGTLTYAGPNLGSQRRKVIPERTKNKCPFCDTTVDSAWTYCGTCGKKIRHE
ncbi:MAG: hypothetical protein ACTSQE_00490 [Candidatus Heimdallarchaeaceae archaeon]